MFISYILEPLALFSTIFLTYLNHTRQRSSSTALLLFWPLFAAVGGIWIRTRHDVGLEFFWQIAITKVVITGLGLISFALECISPEYGLGLQLAEKTFADSPILTANVFSIWVCIFKCCSASHEITYHLVFQLDDSFDEERCKTIHFGTGPPSPAI